MALSPLPRGNFTSSMHTSGWCSRAASTASSGSKAVATTQCPLSASMALADKGHWVVATALDPDEAVEAAREHQPDVCMLDVKFPRGNGLNAIRRIHAVSADTKVVIFSGTTSAALVADAIAQGAQGFVGKEKR